MIFLSSSSASLKKSESYALQQSEKSPTSLIEQISSSVLNMSPFDISNFNALKNADDIRSTMKPIGNDSRIFSENEKVQNAVK